MTHHDPRRPDMGDVLICARRFFADAGQESPFVLPSEQAEKAVVLPVKNPSLEDTISHEKDL